MKYSPKLTLLFCLICQTPIANRGLRVDRQPFSMSWGWKKLENTTYAWLIATICCNTCPMVASGGFYQSPGPPPSGDAHGIVPAHCCSHQNGQQRLGQYGASSPLMVASSGFEGSPGHAASGNAICIVSEHRRGHQNGQQQRCICSSFLPLFHDNT